jgi:FtsP/CotA-like multicopper oxidase with cupredoxin domain
MEEKMKKINRRDFLRYTGMGLATIVVGCSGGGGGNGGDDTPSPGDGGTPPPSTGGGGGGDNGVVETLNFTITDAMKEMVTHNPGGAFPNAALCYFWVFKEARFPEEVPGPQIFAFEGDRITVNVTNALDGPHSFMIPGRRKGDSPMVDTGPIAPGATVSVTFEVKDPGTYLYHDNLNAPVNRVMGLHGAFVVMPKAAAAGHKLTPYKNPTPAVQQLFDDFGSAPWFPGLAWETGDAATSTPPTRQHIWLLHQPSSVLFEEVGLFARNNPGQDYPAAQFLDLFLNDPFINTSNDPRVPAAAGFPTTPANNRKPNYFTINGQSGHFSHNHGAITPSYRVGEPTLVRTINAGLMLHSMHMHANHNYVTAVNNEPQDRLLWIDTFTSFPMEHYDYMIPYMRPPDVPNVRGIGRADAPLATNTGTAWPPLEEFGRHHPPVGTMRTNFAGTALIDIAQPQSPLIYPMHDHSEPSQTAQGGNYNCGLIAGVNIIGDRNTMMDFPMDEEFRMMMDLGRSTTATGRAAGNEP